ncbi:Rne/Rng family ribonuclease [Nocardioides seonyuensis]|uniref:Ribonuclease E n=1 Tax=Nocardioides seonyuensis TaxID=2518371 RepID=A0A4P7IE92_9ACTN|nr:Rne/Rng family ribonuclease [Nocardioides seonyuensis]QBX54297.1 Rne/Rng family ribonuclease [Nocardioides seonyuensis]
MLDEDQPGNSTENASGEGGTTEAAPAAPDAPAKPVVKKTTRKAPAKRTAKKAAAPAPAPEAVPDAAAPEEQSQATAPEKPVVKKTTRKAPAKRTAKKAAPATDTAADSAQDTLPEMSAEAEPTPRKSASGRATKKATAPRKRAASKPEADVPLEVEAGAEDAPLETPSAGVGAVLFQAPDATKAPVRRSRKKAAAVPPVEDAEDTADDAADDAPVEVAGAAEAEVAQAATDEVTDEESAEDAAEEGAATRRRRRRGGRRRRKPGDGAADQEGNGDDEQPADVDDDSTAESPSGEGKDDDQGGEGEPSSRRRRRRRRTGEEGGGDEGPNTVTRVRKSRTGDDQITAVSGSTRLEAKKQRRREGREAGRRRAPIVSEAEFLARRESVDRTMVIRQRQDLTQIAVLEDKVLVEHYVARESQTSLIGNIYLGRVQNVLPSMEAAFIDIGKGRNAVLYAGEVNWSALGHKEGQARKIESVLQSGQSVLVQVTKDPVGHKGARLTSQISLAGRFLVYVPDGTTSGISRKLPDTERNRLKNLLKEIVPDTAGVIVRTAAEGASEEELTRDVERLKARWEDVEKKSKGSAPQLLYGEPDLTLKVVRDLFTEDFAKLVIEGDDAWATVHDYVEYMAPDLAERMEKFERGPQEKDVFAVHRIDEQIHKGLDRKVWLPSGGSLIIDRTEAMTVVDVNTGKFTGSGGNLEETVTKNNLEAAEEIVRQLRLRDIGGIIVIDFIDMVLESNRDLVVRRLVECLGRDRTRHQVAEVTSLGLVQMTRKRIGTGLLEAFSENCEHCHGRGVVIKDAPVEPSKSDDEGRRSNRRKGRKGDSDDNGSSDNESGKDRSGRGSGRGGRGSSEPAAQTPPSPKDVAAMARPDKPVSDAAESGDTTDETTPTRQPEPAPEPVVPDAAPEQSEPVVPDAAPEPVEQVEPPASPEPEPTKPAVVTRTRRRAASRPAGPPELVPVGVAGSSPTTGQVEPGTATVEPGVAGDDAAPVEHVPIKKKGPRKR